MCLVQHECTLNEKTKYPVDNVRPASTKLATTDVINNVVNFYAVGAVIKHENKHITN